MALQGDDHVSQGDLMRRIRDLERQVKGLQTARRLEAASIGQGGMTVHDGAIVILDSDGNEQMRLSTDGLTLGGLLEILGGGNMRWEDPDANRRFDIGNTQVQGVDAIRLEYRDSTGEGRVALGEIRDLGTGALNGHGILVEYGDGGDLLSVHDGVGLIFRNTAGDAVLWANGEVARLSAFPAGGGFVEFGNDRDDQLDLYDDSGNFRATVGPVTWNSNPDGFGVYVTDGTGTDRFFVSANRIWLRTTNGQEGEVTAGAADSAGAGFRTLRIPN